MLLNKRKKCYKAIIFGSDGKGRLLPPCKLAKCCTTIRQTEEAVARIKHNGRRINNSGETCKRAQKQWQYSFLLASKLLLHETGGCLNSNIFMELIAKSLDYGSNLQQQFAAQTMTSSTNKQICAR